MKKYSVNKQYTYLFTTHLSCFGAQRTTIWKVVNIFPQGNIVHVGLHEYLHSQDSCSECTDTAGELRTLRREARYNKYYPFIVTI